MNYRDIISIEPGKRGGRPEAGGARADMKLLFDQHLSFKLGCGPVIKQR